MDINIKKQEILKLVREDYALRFGEKKSFVPGQSRVNYGGRYFDAEEIVNLVDSSLDFWLTAGPWACNAPHLSRVALRKSGKKVCFRVLRESVMPG